MSCLFFFLVAGLEAMDRLRFSIDEPNQRLNLQRVPYWAHAMEKYRWPTTMAVQGTYVPFPFYLIVQFISKL